MISLANGLTAAVFKQKEQIKAVATQLNKPLTN